MPCKKHPWWIALIVAGLIVPQFGCDMFQSTGSRDELSPRTRQLLGQAEQFRQQGQLEAALATFEQVLQNNPDLTTAHMGMGDIYRIQGNYEKAAVKYETARRLEPQNFKANYNLGLMYHLLNRLRDAIKTYLAALVINPDSFEANLNLATAYLQIHQPQLGLPYAEAAVRLKPDSQPAQVNLGSIYASMGQHHLAIDAYRAAAELGDLEPQIMLNLCDSLIRVGHYQRAANTLNVLTGTRPDALVYERLGYVYFKMGQFDQSLKSYREALVYDPKYVPALNGVGVILMTQYLQGRRADVSLRDRAVKSWQQSVQIQPDQQRIIDLIARYRKL